MTEQGIVLSAASRVTYWPRRAERYKYTPKEMDGWGDDDGSCRPVEVSAGGYTAETSFFCAIVECDGSRDDAVECWGSNEEHELGEGTTTAAWSSPTQVLHLPGGNYSSLSCGTHSSCVVVNGAAVWCWGDNQEYGALGVGNTNEYSRAQEVQGLSEAVVSVVDVGHYAACASVGSTGKVECWGNNDDGLLGDGTTTPSTTPVANGVNKAVQLDVGVTHACALNSKQQVFCWGDNDAGQLGDGGTSTDHTPVLASVLAEQ